MATLVRQSRLPELDLMERRFRRMFEGIPLMPAFLPPTLPPAADVYETPTEVVVELEVPGYTENELALEIVDHTLRVTGTQTQTEEEKDKTFRLHERLERSFERTFVLPAEIDSDKLTAKFGKGVLEVHAPKLAERTPRKVAITQ